jgi:hypothetical protein
MNQCYVKPLVTAATAAIAEFFQQILGDLPLSAQRFSRPP